jgi:crossover junction endodeoxyribonuclease RuvC
MKKEQPDPHEEVRKFVARVADTGETIYLGIDPGVSGALGFVCGVRYCVVDIPGLKVAVTRSKKLSEAEAEATGRKTRSVKGESSEYDNPGVVALFRLLKPVKDRVRVCLEIGQIQRKGKGANAQTGYKVGIGYGMWPLFLCSKGYPVEEVAPAVWKARMGLVGKDKEASRRKALGLFPRAALSRKQDHNRAEALLLADYLRRINQ